MTTPKKQLFRYGGTITFGPNYTLEQKLKVIKNIPSIFSSNLRHSKNSEYYLIYTVEYHKVGPDDDLQAPHVHFILTSIRQLQGLYFRNITQVLRDIGRSQFYLMTELKYKQYHSYILKDCDKYDIQTNGIHHHLELYLEEPETLSNMEITELIGDL